MSIQTTLYVYDITGAGNKLRIQFANRGTEINKFQTAQTKLDANPQPQARIMLNYFYLKYLIRRKKLRLLNII